MQCFRCHDTNGPFIVDIKSNKCSCESCHYLDLMSYYAKLYIDSDRTIPLARKLRIINKKLQEELL